MLGEAVAAAEPGALAGLLALAAQGAWQWQRRRSVTHLPGFTRYRADVDLRPAPHGGTHIHWHTVFRSKVPGCGWLYRAALDRATRRFVAGLAGAAKLLEATFEFPYLAHAALEPMNRLLIAAQALREGLSVEEVHAIAKYDPWFLQRIEEIVAAVRREHGEVEYVADAEALEWVQSQTMTAADLAEVEAVFAAADAAVGG